MNQLGKLTLCLFFVLLCVSSFVEAKHKKEISNSQKQGGTTVLDGPELSSDNIPLPNNQLESVYNQQTAQDTSSDVQKIDPNAINYENSTDWIILPNDGSALPAASCSVGGFDLSPMTRGTGQDFSYTNSEGTFYVNICAAVTGGGCANTVSACQRGTNGSPYNNGILSAMTLKSSGGTVSVTYGQGQMCGTTPRSTIVNIICDQTTVGTITSVSINTCSTPYTISMKSKYVCSSNPSSSPSPLPKTKSASLSNGASPLPPSPPPPPTTDSGSDVVGWIIIGVVVGLFVCYLIGGFVYNKKRVGTEGFVDSIPNSGFWKDLPFLVKDGIVFTFSRIKRLIFREGYTQL